MCDGDPGIRDIQEQSICLKGFALNMEAMEADISPS